MNKTKNKIISFSSFSWEKMFETQTLSGKMAPDPWRLIIQLIQQ